MAPPFSPPQSPGPAASAADGGGGNDNDNDNDGNTGADVYDPCYCEKLESALRQAMMIFGAPMVDALVKALRDQYGVRLGPNLLPCSSLQEIEGALEQIAGSGAKILMNRIREFL
jgi:hypothetical protein